MPDRVPIGDLPHKDLRVAEVENEPVILAERRYVHGRGLVAEELGDGSWRYYHGDMLGSARLITDDEGAVVANPAYTAFGEPLGHTALFLGDGVTSGGVAQTRYGWCGSWGYQSDGLSGFGLIHIGARYYEPSIGRFIQRDPIGYAGGANVLCIAATTLRRAWIRRGASHMVNSERALLLALLSAH